MKDKIIFYLGCAVTLLTLSTGVLAWAHHVNGMHIDHLRSLIAKKDLLNFDLTLENQRVSLDYMTYLYKTRDRRKHFPQTDEQGYYILPCECCGQKEKKPVVAIANGIEIHH